METEVAKYFAFSVGPILLVASVYKMIIDKENYKGYFIPFVISLIIMIYGVFRYLL